MSGRLRRTSRSQGEREIIRKQEGFLGGLDNTHPAGSIDATQLADLENFIPYRDRLEARSGCVELSATTFPAGTMDIFQYVGGSFGYICVVANVVYYSGDLGTWTSAGSVGSVVTSVHALGEETVIIIGYDAKIWRLYYGTSSKSLRQVNTTTPIWTEAHDATGAYTYHYAFSWVRITSAANVTLGTGTNRKTSGSVVRAESGGNTNASQLETYHIDTTANPIDSTNTNTVFSYGTQIATAPPAGSWTHVGVYRTLNLGTADVDEHSEFTYYWVGDLPFSDTTFVDNRSDEDISAEVNFKSRRYVPISNGYNATVTPALFFSTTNTNQNMIAYSENDETIGYHNPLMSEELDDAVINITPITDRVLITANGKTYTKALYGETNAGIAESGEYAPVFPASSLIDNNIGVVGTQRLCSAGDGMAFALCNDKTIRLFDGERWGNSLSDDISAFVNTAVSVLMFYSPSGYLMLWASTSGADPQMTNCYRLGLREDVGLGWTKLTGDGFPDLEAQGYGKTATLSGTGLIYVANDDTGTPYAIETVGSSRIASDNNATDIVCKAKTREMTGAYESYTCRHLESHAYWRPYGSSFETGLEVTARAYVDGSSTASAVALISPKKRDISFDKVVSGNRFQLELETNKGNISLLGTDTYLSVQDRNTFDQDPTEDTYQGEFSSPAFWLGSNSLYGVSSSTAPVNMADGSVPSTASGTMTGISDVVSSTGAFDMGAGTPDFKWAGGTTFSDFTAMFWIKYQSFSNTGVMPQIQYANNSFSFSISMSSATNLKIRIEPSTEINTAVSNWTTGGTSGWHHFAMTRASGVIKLYQNGSLVGTLGTVSDSIGGGDFIVVGLGAGGSDNLLFDLRFFGYSINAEAITYYYNNVVSYEGAAVLPSR